MGFSFCLVLVLVNVLVLVSADLCPNMENTDFCTCKTDHLVGPGLHMTCYSLQDPRMVLVFMKGAPEVVSLRLIRCDLPSLPIGLAPHSLASLEIINSTMPYISSPLTTGSAFDGLTNLTSITIKGVHDLTGWDWAKLVPLKGLQKLHIEDSRLPVLPNTLSGLVGTNFWSLNITNTQTLSIAPNALGSARLKVFSSRGNPLSSIRTNMFQPGKAVSQLELVGTRITSLSPRELAELTTLSILVTDAHFLSFLGNNPFYTPLHSLTVVGKAPKCHFNYCFLRNHGLQWGSECHIETSTVTASFIMAEFLITAC